MLPTDHPQTPAQSASTDELLGMVYDELRSLAARQLARESQSHTLQPTALVHEAWLRLAHATGRDWKDRTHFFRASALAMRRILVDRARERKSLKRSGDPVEFELHGEAGVMTVRDNHLLVIDECLERMEKEDPESARIVHLKFFAGLSNEETAKMLEMPLRSVERQWAFARAKLFQMIREEDPSIGENHGASR
jgi:RNA polymerase sigma factor (TIGR02999 family)